VLLVLGAAALALVGCGSDDDKRTSGESTKEPRTVLLDKATKTILDQPLAYPSASAAQVSSVIVRLQPGDTTGFHRHDAPLYVYVLAGEVTVHYDGNIVKKYPAGTSFLEAQGTYHDGRNEGTEPVEILTVSIGAEGIENTVARP
jgi:quercetin dioxygenase-like cupin family protein